ncbi:hypothetical protein AVEN_124308-1 [Araneus ventricosus]|uniref:Uncharacterized protein n=1 Tax=Araneus ventricosus TaxID=182803 RepID=A0A4Y2RKK5_ARAVE|nr:hypothetical protein AVEN_124308-1 [Araneus ventricosus]
MEKSLSEKEEVTAKRQSSSAIREMLKVRKTVASYIEKYHPKTAVAMRATNLFYAFTPHCYLLTRWDPSHWGTDVRAFLDTTFPSRWMGRGVPIAWPPRSPDNILLDILVGLRRGVRDVEGPRASITAVIATVTTEMLQQTWLKPDYRRISLEN